MVKKQWETVMLSKETKEKLKELKGKESYESMIDTLIAHYKRSDKSVPAVSIDLKPEFDRLITEYLEPMKDYIKQTTPDEQLMNQANQLYEEYTQLQEELGKAEKRIAILTQNNDRLKNKKR